MRPILYETHRKPAYTRLASEEESLPFIREFDNGANHSLIGNVLSAGWLKVGYLCPLHQLQKQGGEENPPSRIGGGVSQRGRAIGSECTPQPPDVSLG